MRNGTQLWLIFCQFFNLLSETYFQSFTPAQSSFARNLTIHCLSHTLLFRAFSRTAVFVVLLEMFFFFRLYAMYAVLCAFVCMCSCLFIRFHSLFHFNPSSVSLCVSIGCELIELQNVLICKTKLAPLR